MKTQRNLKTKCIFLTIVLFAIYQYSGFGKTKDPELKSMSYKAYLTSSKSLWEEVVKKCETQYRNSNGNHGELLTLTNAQYGLLNNCFANKDKNTFKEIIDKVEKNMKLLLKTEGEKSTTHSLISAIYGAKMGFNPMKGMFLGNKSNEHLNKALNLDKNNAQAYRIKASSKFFTPEIYGGSIEESIGLYEKAIKLYEDQNNIEENWEYIDCLAWLGIANKKLGNKDKAIQIYNKALKIEPNFSWVKVVLLPAAQKLEDK